MPIFLPDLSSSLLQFDISAPKRLSGSQDKFRPMAKLLEGTDTDLIEHEPSTDSSNSLTTISPMPASFTGNNLHTISVDTNTQKNRTNDERSLTPPMDTTRDSGEGKAVDTTENKTHGFDDESLAEKHQRSALAPREDGNGKVHRQDKSNSAKQLPGKSFTDVTLER